MIKQHKDILATVIRDLRHDLLGYTAKDGNPVRGDLDRELERLGVLPDGRVQPIDALPNATAPERQAHYAAEQFIDAARRQGKAAGEARKEFVEQAGYSWINRLVALRALEARRLINGTLRPTEDYGGVSEALFLLAQTDPARVAAPDGGWYAVLENACAAQAAALPGLFGAGDPVLTLRPSITALRRCVERIGNGPASATAEATDAAFADPDAIGWAYQFYQEEAKAAAFASFKAGKKADSRATIAAATQLFTEPYMVKWLLQNSLGRSYHEIYPDSQLPASWEYYIRPDDERRTTKDESSAAASVGVVRGEAEASSLVLRPSSLVALTVLDPCVGSGHFLREAFDLLAAMYREQHPDWDAQRVVETILRQHLHGIDIDPRAVQLAALTLYMRALELLRDEARARRRPMPRWTPPQINLATTPGMALTPVAAATPPLPSQRERGPGGEGPLDRHLQRHPEDRPLRPVLERIFETLSQAEILGSLLRPGAEIDAAIADTLTPKQTSLFDESANNANDANGSEAEIRAIRAIRGSDTAELKRLVLDRIAAAFGAEAGSADPADALFGREAERGVRLLQLLDRKYTVVVTNPPYMGSKNMPDTLKKYVEQNYKPGKRDLYAAFILRCLDLCLHGGRVSMITPQVWMFLRRFVEMRIMAEEKMRNSTTKNTFRGLLHETQFEGLVQLGRHAFSEADPPANPVMFVLRTISPSAKHTFYACRLVASRLAEEQNILLQQIIQSSQENNNSEEIFSQEKEGFFEIVQSVLSSIPEAPMCYWLSASWLDLLSKGRRLENIAFVREGLHTTDNIRFLRCFWECLVTRSPAKDRHWVPYLKGGGYRRWSGLEWLCVDWEHDGARIKSTDAPVVPSYELYFQPGFTYTDIARGSLGVRYYPEGCIFDAKGPVIIMRKGNSEGVACLANTRPVSFMLRALSPSMQFRTGYVNLVPIPDNYDALGVFGNICITLSSFEHRLNLMERLFDIDSLIVKNYSKERQYVELISVFQSVNSVRLLIEGLTEQLSFKMYGLAASQINEACRELGTPAGFHPLLAGYDALPELPAELELPELPHEVIEYLEQHERLTPSPTELAQIKARLRTLYEAGYGAKDEGADDAGDAEGGEADESEAAVAGAHIPIPTETFLEELSVRMELHPISVYWLLEELRAEGVRCKPEERRLLEDRLSVLALRLLGHHWPRELDEGRKTEDEFHSDRSSPVPRLPSWADPDGIIPLVNLGTGEATLAERLRERLREEDDTVGAQRTEALLSELTGATSLEDWLARIFWPRHVRQFKSRPIAWHLASKPVAATGTAGGGRGRRSSVVGRRPLFECMVYYHATGGDALARLRTQYVEPLLRREESALNEALGKDNTEAAASATLRVQELRDFLARIQQVEREGFACAELDTLLAKEPLDRWSGDGIAPPAGRDDLVRQERAWRVDLNDGVRVNIAPIQLAGLLPGEVLRAADAKKAIADRARWRADERRWVREGKLPRPGWLPESVPESPEWIRKAPERAAEKAKLEEKRRAATKADILAGEEVL